MQSSKSEVRSLRLNWRKLSQLAAFPLFVSIATLLLASSEWSRAQRLMSATAPLQLELGTYVQAQGQLHDSFGHIGAVPMGENASYYQRLAGHGCILWLGSHFGESTTFHAQNGR